MTTIGFGDYVPGQDAKDQSVSVVRFHVVFLALYAKIFELTHCNTPTDNIILPAYIYNQMSAIPTFYDLQLFH